MSLSSGRQDVLISPLTRLQKIAPSNIRATLTCELSFMHVCIKQSSTFMLEGLLRSHSVLEIFVLCYRACWLHILGFKTFSREIKTLCFYEF